MSEEWETKGQQVARAKTGLQILYARCEAGDQPGDLAERDVPGELRERYWIRRAGRCRYQREDDGPELHDQHSAVDRAT